jgi:hypothetical protein
VSKNRTERQRLLRLPPKERKRKVAQDAARQYPGLLAAAAFVALWTKFLREEPDRAAPTSSTDGVNTFNFGPPFSKPGEVDVNGPNGIKLLWKPLWEQAREKAGLVPAKKPAAPSGGETPPPRDVSRKEGAAGPVVPDQRTRADLKKRGEQVLSKMDAERRMGDGERIFAFSESDEQPVELFTIEQIGSTTADRLMALPPAEKAGSAKRPVEAAPTKALGIGSTNKVFTEDAAEKARALLKKKLGQINAGLDPEVIQAGIQLAGYYIEGGARRFRDYSKKMIADLGEAVRPYLKAWYLAVRNYPGFDKTGMESEAEVEAIEKALERENELRAPKKKAKPLPVEIENQIQDTNRRLAGVRVELRPTDWTPGVGYWDLDDDNMIGWDTLKSIQSDATWFDDVVKIAQEYRQGSDEDAAKEREQSNGGEQQHQGADGNRPAAEAGGGDSSAKGRQKPTPEDGLRRRGAGAKGAEVERSPVDEAAHQAATSPQNGKAGADGAAEGGRQLREGARRNFRARHLDREPRRFRRRLRGRS